MGFVPFVGLGDTPADFGTGLVAMAPTVVCDFTVFLPKGFVGFGVGAPTDETGFTAVAVAFPTGCV